MRFYRVGRRISGKENGKWSKTSLHTKNRAALSSPASAVVSSQQPNHQQTEQHHEHAKKPNLSFLQLEHLLEQGAPNSWRDHGEQALQDEHETQCHQEGIEQDLLPGRRAAGRPTHTFEKFGAAGVEHHHI